MPQDKLGPTPTPWKVDELALGSIVTPEGDTIAQTMQMLPRDKDPFHVIRKANAELIVRAVNNMGMLLTVCHEVASHLYTRQDIERCKEMAQAALERMGK